MSFASFGASYKGCSELLSLDDSKKPIYALWSNRGKSIAWGGGSIAGSGEYTKTYRYEDEKVLAVQGANDYQTGEVTYSSGGHNSKLSQIYNKLPMIQGVDTCYPNSNYSNDILYFEKRGKFWWLVGHVSKATLHSSQDSSQDSCNQKWSLLIDFLGANAMERSLTKKIGIKLAKNKKNSLELLGFAKKIGKGTGNLNQGICNISLIPGCETYCSYDGNIWRCAVSSLAILMDSTARDDDTRLWWDRENQALWYRIGSNVVKDQNYIVKKRSSHTPVWTKPCDIIQWHCHEKPDFDY